jgi:enoyl-CoA hydratase
MIERERHGPVTLLRLAHGKANALDVELLRALEGELAASDGGGAVVLTGRGHIFSAGVDLPRVLAEDRAYLERLFAALADLLRVLFLLPRPAVVALNGHALAGGWILACACDYRIGARGPGTIGLTELRAGVPFPRIALEIVRHATPPPHFEAMVLTGGPLLMEAAHRAGLLHELAAADELVPRAIAAAERMAALDPEAFAATKRRLREPALATAGEDLAETAALWDRPATRARVRAYMEELKKK